jgi:hypothetical protein
MRFALDTYREVRYGNAERRIRALFTFAMWFVAGAYLTSTILFYISPLDGASVSAIGGLAVACIAATLKSV